MIEEREVSRRTKLREADRENKYVSPRNGDVWCNQGPIQLVAYGEVTTSCQDLMLSVPTITGNWRTVRISHVWGTSHCFGLSYCFGLGPIVPDYLFTFEVVLERVP